jgi:ParB-like chromosome segregation protein Spo0J
MAYQKIKISSLELAPWNYKEDDAKLQAKLVKNIQSNGQVENIVVREIGEGKYEVVNGNHRLKAFREIGLSTVMAYNLGRHI